ncbi:MAG: SH3 domain-containing protein [Anaerolineales bacterium]
MKTILYLALAGLMTFLTACNLNFNVNLPTSTPGAAPTATPSVTATAASPFAWPDEAGTCTLTTDDVTVLYDRPSTEAQVFSEVESGFTAVVTGRTFDGWVGFDPGIAQAANSGVFRLRWVHFDEVSLSGSCLDAPQLSWVPEPDLCYVMPQESVSVYSGANTTSNVIATLNVEDFAAVSGLTNNGWAQVDLGAGNTGLSGIGWMQEADLNVNGGTCDELPTVSP